METTQDTTLRISMPDAVLDVVDDSGDRRSVIIDHTPFRIGRAGDGSNDLVLADARVSRQSSAIVCESGEFIIEDLGQRRGLFLNGRIVEGRSPIHEGDVVTFGNTDALNLIFRGRTKRESLSDLLSRMESPGASQPIDHDLRQLNLLLEATALLHSHMPLEEVLGAMVDRAIAVTEADRGVLLEADADEALLPMVVRRRGGFNLPPTSVSPSQTAIDRALSERHGFVEQDVQLAAESVRQAASIVNQQLRSVVAIPLYAPGRFSTADSSETRRVETPLLGVLYVDSQRPAAFSGLGRQVLDALAIEAASVIDNARMVKLERERRRMEQDLSIAREIQRRLLPKEFRRYPHVEICGTTESCYSVGGDYFDLVELDDGRFAFIVADVAGKGLAAALLTALIQGGFAGIALIPEPARVINQLNRYIWTRSEPNRYATAIIGVLSPDGTLECINAGHHAGLLVRNGEVRQVFPSESFPIGMFPDAKYTGDQMVLENGDMLLLFSDGITEAENIDGEEFGMDRVVETVGANTGGTPKELSSALLERIAAFSEGREQTDDMTLLVLRYRRTS
jgi:serine phosphatase RsbU (regulator of sigma subunit)/pSer/pThr/pTyr-binding forkhead associated (FHA) protein